MIFDFIFAAKELSKIVYALIMCGICGLIVIKLDRLFKLSDHQGLRYFRNAFFFYGISFIMRFILGGIDNPLGSEKLNSFFYFLTNQLFGFFTIMAGFFLFYSLTWRKLEKESNHNSFFNARIFIFYFLTLIIIFLNIFLNSSFVIYLSQIIIFVIITILAFVNFLKYYFLIMVLGLGTWVLGLFGQILASYSVINMFVYILNIIFFVSFFYMINKILSGKNG